LDLGKVAVFGSKVHAFYVLAKESEKHKFFSELTEIFMIIYGDKGTFEDKLSVFLYLRLRTFIGAWSQASKALKFPTDLKSMTAEHFHQLMEPFYFPIFQTEGEAKSHYLKSLYVSAMFPSEDSRTHDSPFFNSELMPIAIHDWLDQDICKMARHARIDTVVIQREVGERRCVTELLDTRDHSYSHLIRVMDRDALSSPWYQPNPLYPTVWFMKDNGFVSCCPTKDLKINGENGNRVE
jgi:hypothetical protein